MTTFIDKVLQEILSRDTHISEYTFILPSKRAGSYLLHQLAAHTKQPIFAPKILSIEDFAQEVSGLQSVDNVTALFEFYSAYKECTPKENLEDFDTFSSWAQALLHDFNEIDRYLIDYKSFFGYLSKIQEVSHWSLQKERTSLMENYLSFWNKLPLYYEQLKQQLEKRDVAYQGMVYRRASERIEDYQKENKNPHVFIGFNALNTAEQEIFQYLLEKGSAEIFWDIEESFFRDEEHDVSHFHRSYTSRWPYYKKHSIQNFSADFCRDKHIEVIGVPKNIGQAKYVGELLAKMSSEEIRKTAVVLGDENLLLPTLNSLPSNVEEVNVTMGFALKNAPVAFLFDHLLKIHSGHKDDWYYKDLSGLISHPLFQTVTKGKSHELLEKIKKENLVYLSPEYILNHASTETAEIYKLCFSHWGDNPNRAIANLLELIYLIKNSLDPKKDKIGLEFLYQLHLMLNKLSNLLQEYPHIKTIKTLYAVYKSLVSMQTVDFRGKPFTGLQLMGVLESRVLDFKNVILLSVNEGVLPAGKGSNSFIPFDLKCAYNLPTYKEKDAIYAYHFYHLLQRASNAYLLYNTESDGLNAGEKSRFLLQLEMEKKEQHTLSHYTIMPKVPTIKSECQVIYKTPAVMAQLAAVAGRGFSPSALTTYVRNPLDFYKQYVLGIREREEVEETVAYNTLGTVVHDTLEKFYKQWEGEELTIENLEKAIAETAKEIHNQFYIHYTSQPIKNGKNLLIFEVAKRYVTNFLKSEISNVKKGNRIRILQVENSLSCRFPMDELPFPVQLKGMVDRVDIYNGKMRIIDYKTGKVEQNKVEIVDWDEINTDYDKYSKPFQVLMYVYLLNAEKAISEPVEAGIISFKNLQNGFLKFLKKDKNGRGATKDPEITKDILDAFENQLRNLILEICNPNIPFEEKEIKKQIW